MLPCSQAEEDAELTFRPRINPGIESSTGGRRRRRHAAPSSPNASAAPLAVPVWLRPVRKRSVDSLVRASASGPARSASQSRVAETAGPTQEFSAFGEPVWVRPSRNRSAESLAFASASAQALTDSKAAASEAVPNPPPAPEAPQASGLSSVRAVVEDAAPESPRASAPTVAVEAVEPAPPPPPAAGPAPPPDDDLPNLSTARSRASSAARRTTARASHSARDEVGAAASLPQPPPLGISPHRRRAGAPLTRLIQRVEPAVRWRLCSRLASLTRACALCVGFAGTARKTLTVAELQQLTDRLSQPKVRGLCAQARCSCAHVDERLLAHGKQRAPQPTRAHPV
jgi:hypothetical protein